MAGPVTLTCPRCRRAFTIPTEVMGVDGHQVIVRMDRSEVVNHECVETASDAPGVALERWTPTDVPQVELVGRIHRMLETGAFLDTRGSRACNMCGTTGQTCLDQLRDERRACCDLCRDGNTHPVPQESLPCAVWAEDREAER